MPSVLLKVVVLLAVSSALTSPLYAVSYREDSPMAPVFKKQSSSNKAPATTQKTYQIKNDGKTSKSSTVEYTHQPFHEVFEDSDADGRFGEKEAPLIDSDGDGRLGERENQLGNESVSQNQKITVLNNMNFGKLSDFKAAGQIQRSSIYKTTNTQEPPKNSSKTEPSPAPAKAKVLVS